MEQHFDHDQIYSQESTYTCNELNSKEGRLEKRQEMQIRNQLASTLPMELLVHREKNRLRKQKWQARKKVDGDVAGIRNPPEPELQQQETTVPGDIRLNRGFTHSLHNDRMNMLDHQAQYLDQIKEEENTSSETSRERINHLRQKEAAACEVNNIIKNINKNSNLILTTLNTVLGKSAPMIIQPVLLPKSTISESFTTLKIASNEPTPIIIQPEYCASPIAIQPELEGFKVIPSTTSMDTTECNQLTQEEPCKRLTKSPTHTGDCSSRARSLKTMKIVSNKPTPRVEQPEYCASPMATRLGSILPKPDGFKVIQDTQQQIIQVISGKNMESASVATGEDSQTKHGDDVLHDNQQGNSNYESAQIANKLDVYQPETPRDRANRLRRENRAAQKDAAAQTEHQSETARDRANRYQREKRAAQKNGSLKTK